MEIRPLKKQDVERIVEFSLRAWEPVYESLEKALGEEIFRRQHPDWRGDQRRAVEGGCDPESGRVWVAEGGGVVVGFVAVELNSPEEFMGEVSILGVDPDFHGGGVGTALTEFATEKLREAGMRVAMVETGGDPGHAAARRTYEKAGYTLLPIARYFRNL
ncbi:GNAT family N-acetyltransferase [Rubrobacter indicoceani]|uniref:GNAT family N-acetyltransferase n=1 Tax=Rubrobacter indicoceani TaxID=2051957 RepID=UPI000E5A44E0|nr:GNAT family N-acetyltransferase [Rubrobacter indicoceani]